MKANRGQPMKNVYVGTLGICDAAALPPKDLTLAGRQTVSREWPERTTSEYSKGKNVLSELMGDTNGQKRRRMGNICWFTNLDFPKRHENLHLCDIAIRRKGGGKR